MLLRYANSCAALGATDANEESSVACSTIVKAVECSMDRPQSFADIAYVRSILHGLTRAGPAVTG